MGAIMVFCPLDRGDIIQGYLINHCLSSGRKKAWALAVTASVFIFSWLHTRSPEQKVAGAVFTLVYLWGRGNNMVAAIVTHAVGNATILFLGFSSLGITAATGVLAIVASMIFLFDFNSPGDFSANL